MLIPKRDYQKASFNTIAIDDIAFVKRMVEEFYEITR